MLEWTEQPNSNWKAISPSGTTIIVFKRNNMWSWCATRKYKDTPTYSENQWDDPGDAKEDIGERCAPISEAVIPELPIDLFEYNVEGIENV